MYKAYRRLDSKGSADLNEPEILELYKSKFINGPDRIPKLSNPDHTQVDIKPDEGIIDKIITKLDPTSGGGLDGLSNKMLRQIWNIRENLNLTASLLKFWGSLINETFFFLVG